MNTYQLSAYGRRTILVLLLSALIIWGFALWSFRSTLNLSYNPVKFWATLSASIEAGLSVSQLVPALLFLVLIIVTPLLIWNLLEEWSATYTLTEEGLRFTSLGIDILYPWEHIKEVQRTDDDSDEPVDELLIASDETHQIRNPVLRFLHAQAYGRCKLPIYPGLAGRDTLLAEIKQRAGLPVESEAAAATDAA